MSDRVDATECAADTSARLGVGRHKASAGLSAGLRQAAGRRRGETSLSRRRRRIVLGLIARCLGWTRLFGLGRARASGLAGQKAAVLAQVDFTDHHGQGQAPAHHHSQILRRRCRVAAACFWGRVWHYRSPGGKDPAARTWARHAACGLAQAQPACADVVGGQDGLGVVEGGARPAHAVLASTARRGFRRRPRSFRVEHELSAGFPRELHRRWRAASAALRL